MCSATEAGGAFIGATLACSFCIRAVPTLGTCCHAGAATQLSVRVAALNTPGWATFSATHTWIARVVTLVADVLIRRKPVRVHWALGDAFVVVLQFFALDAVTSSKAGATCTALGMAGPTSGGGLSADCPGSWIGPGWAGIRAFQLSQGAYKGVPIAPVTLSCECPAARQRLVAVAVARSAGIVEPSKRPAGAPIHAIAVVFEEAALVAKARANAVAAVHRMAVDVARVAVVCGISREFRRALVDADPVQFYIAALNTVRIRRAVAATHALAAAWRTELLLVSEAVRVAVFDTHGPCNAAGFVQQPRLNEVVAFLAGRIAALNSCPEAGALSTLRMALGTRIASPIVPAIALIAPRTNVARLAHALASSLVADPFVNALRVAGTLTAAVHERSQPKEATFAAIARGTDHTIFAAAVTSCGVADGTRNDASCEASAVHTAGQARIRVHAGKEPEFECWLACFARGTRGVLAASLADTFAGFVVRAAIGVPVALAVGRRCTCGAGTKRV